MHIKLTLLMYTNTMLSDDTCKTAKVPVPRQQVLETSLFALLKAQKYCRSLLSPYILNHQLHERCLALSNLCAKMQKTSPRVDGDSTL